MEDFPCGFLISTAINVVRSVEVGGVVCGLGRLGSGRAGVEPPFLHQLPAGGRQEREPVVTTNRRHLVTPRGDQGTSRQGRLSSKIRGQCGACRWEMVEWKWQKVGGGDQSGLAGDSPLLQSSSRPRPSGNLQAAAAAPVLASMLHLTARRPPSLLSTSPKQMN